MRRSGNWFWPVVVSVVTAGIGLWYFWLTVRPHVGLIGAFREGIVADTDSEKVILWARTILADTNTQPAVFASRGGLLLGSKVVEGEQLPPELVGFGTNLFDGMLGRPHVAIYRNADHRDAFVSVGFYAGRASLLGLAIGPTNFTFHTNLSSRSEQWRDGIYFYEVDYTE